MTDEPEYFPLSLGPRTWNLPHFTFGVIKRLQPRVLRSNLALYRDGADGLIQRLDEAALDELLGITHEALKIVEPELTKEALEALPFAASELVAGQTAIMRALGLVRAKGEAEDSAGPKA
jgi:hypothetical protein